MYKKPFCSECLSFKIRKIKRHGKCYYRCKSCGHIESRNSFLYRYEANIKNLFTKKCVSALKENLKPLNVALREFLDNLLTEFNLPI